MTGFPSSRAESGRSRGWRRWIPPGLLGALLLTACGSAEVRDDPEPQPQAEAGLYGAVDAPQCDPGTEEHTIEYPDGARRRGCYAPDDPLVVRSEQIREARRQREAEQLAQFNVIDGPFANSDADIQTTIDAVLGAGEGLDTVRGAVDALMQTPHLTSGDTNQMMGDVQVLLEGTRATLDTLSHIEANTNPVAFVCSGYVRGAGLEQAARRIGETGVPDDLDAEQAQTYLQLLTEQITPWLEQAHSTWLSTVEAGETLAITNACTEAAARSAAHYDDLL